MPAGNWLAGLASVVGAGVRGYAEDKERKLKQKLAEEAEKREQQKMELDALLVGDKLFAQGYRDEGVVPYAPLTFGEQAPEETPPTKPKTVAEALALQGEPQAALGPKLTPPKTFAPVQVERRAQIQLPSIGGQPGRKMERVAGMAEEELKETAKLAEEEKKKAEDLAAQRAAYDYLVKNKGQAFAGGEFSEGLAGARGYTTLMQRPDPTPQVVTKTDRDGVVRQYWAPPGAPASQHVLIGDAKGGTRLEMAARGYARNAEARIKTAATEAPQILKRMADFEAKHTVNGVFTLPWFSQAAGQVGAGATSAHPWLALTQEAAARLGDPEVTQYIADANRASRLFQLVAARGGSEAMAGQESRLFRANIGDNAEQVEAARVAREAMFGKFGSIMMTLSEKEKAEVALALDEIAKGRDAIDLGEGDVVQYGDILPPSSLGAPGIPTTPPPTTGRIPPSEVARALDGLGNPDASMDEIKDWLKAHPRR